MVRPRPRRHAPATIYPHAVVLDGAALGEDTVIGAFTFVGARARIGAGTRVQGHTSIWDGVTLGEDVFVGPGAMFTNVKRPRAAFSRSPPDRPWDRTEVGRGASIGARATLVAPVTIGAHAMIGAGAVVTRDVPAHAVAYGVPAKVRAWACTCGEPVARGAVPPARASCGACGRVLGLDGAGGLAELSAGAPRSSST